MYDGILYKNIPEITQRPIQLGVGGAGVDIEPYFLCGRAAMAMRWASLPAQSRWRTVTMSSSPAWH
jgi:hypothetical protein